MDEQTSNQPSYYAVIPANVRYAKIPANAKLLYGEITALCNLKGYCWATNEYFSTLYSANIRTISRWVSFLEDKGFIIVDVNKQKGNVRHISLPPLTTKMSIPIDKNVHTYSITSNTSTKVEGLDKPTKTKTNPIKGDVFGKKYGNGEVNTVLDAISKLTPTGKLDGSEFQNRQRAHNLIQKYGLEPVIETIKLIPKVPFWKDKVTSPGLLLKHYNAIISSLPAKGQDYKLL